MLFNKSQALAIAAAGCIQAGIVCMLIAPAFSVGGGGE